MFVVGTCPDLGRRGLLLYTLDVLRSFVVRVCVITKKLLSCVEMGRKCMQIV